MGAGRRFGRRGVGAQGPNHDPRIPGRVRAPRSSTPGATASTRCSCFRTRCSVAWSGSRSSRWRCSLRASGTRAAPTGWPQWPVAVLRTRCRRDRYGAAGAGPPSAARGPELLRDGQCGRSDGCMECRPGTPDRSLGSSPERHGQAGAGADASRTSPVESWPARSALSVRPDATRLVAAPSASINHRYRSNARCRKIPVVR